MTTALAIISIIAALAMGAVSPGPSFVLVARTAAAAGRREALATALGLGCGAFTFAVMALLGLHAVFTAVPWAYAALKLGSGAYLIFLAYKIWHSARQPLPSLALADASRDADQRRILLRAYFRGLATQLSNPKTAVVFAGVFAALMPEHPAPAFYLIVPIAAFVIDAGWYTIVSCALSAAAPRAVYLRYKAWIDRLAGTIMGLLGLKLISMVRQ
ncbi:MAG: LysE family transporter [Burkholderiales bacterium]|jgi:threonine/homoserine/homoserine lactone efflux protein|nr:LysE family transporter [Burkholderiales bacterium]